MSPVIPVQNIHQGKTHRRAEKAPDGMHDGVPMGKTHVVAAQFAQNFCGKDVQQDHDLQTRGKFYAEVLLDKGGDKKENQHQQTDKHAGVIAAQNRQYHHGNHQQAQHGPEDKGLPVVADDGLQVTDLIISFSSHSLFAPLQYSPGN